MIKGIEKAFNSFVSQISIASSWAARKVANISIPSFFSLFSKKVPQTQDVTQIKQTTVTPVPPNSIKATSVFAHTLGLPPSKDINIEMDAILQTKMMWEKGKIKESLEELKTLPDSQKELLLDGLVQDDRWLDSCIRRYGLDKPNTIQLDDFIDLTLSNSDELEVKNSLQTMLLPALLRKYGGQEGFLAECIKREVLEAFYEDNNSLPHKFYKELSGLQQTCPSLKEERILAHCLKSLSDKKAFSQRDLALLDNVLSLSSPPKIKQIMKFLPAEGKEEVFWIDLIRKQVLQCRFPENFLPSALSEVLRKVQAFCPSITEENVRAHALAELNSATSLSPQNKTELRNLFILLQRRR